VSVFSLVVSHVGCWSTQRGGPRCVRCSEGEGSRGEFHTVSKDAFQRLEWQRLCGSGIRREAEI